MLDVMKVLVKDTDMISAKSLLELLSDSITGMKQQAVDNTELTEQNKLAIGGAIEALTDLHNLVLNQLHAARTMEVFEDDSGDRGGQFDA